MGRSAHGQGSRHVAWAKQPASQREEDRAKGLLVKFDERKNSRWVPEQSTGNVRADFQAPKLRKEVETCGLCHARRSQFSEDWVPGRWLSDTHVVPPLTRGLYHVDGQMLDEVYNYGSFKQSKMFAAGVTCSNCHESHSAKLRAPGDGVCGQCHLPEKYAAEAHRHHDSSNGAVTCASCHMPTHTYMVVDQRHDHRLAVPRPDISARLGTPNACNDCHTDKTAAWAIFCHRELVWPETYRLSEFTGTLFTLPRQINQTPQHCWRRSDPTNERRASRGPAL